MANPKFGLQYAVDDAGPLGPAAVELWVTTDGGRTWFSRGEDPDRASPFPVDLGGEGSFGLKLVAKSAANQGDRPPVSGEAPVTVVEVDSSGPAVKLDPPRMVGSKLVINWHASDPHPAPRPVMISIKEDSPDGKWKLITPAPIENSGQYTWTVPAGCPPKIHVRVDVRDSLGNMGFAETGRDRPRPGRPEQAQGPDHRPGPLRPRDQRPRRAGRSEICEQAGLAQAGGSGSTPRSRIVTRARKSSPRAAKAWPGPFEAVQDGDDPGDPAADRPRRRRRPGGRSPRWW